MSFLDKLVPRDERFFDLFEEVSGCAYEAAKALVELLESSGEERERLAVAIEAIEHRADQLTHETMERLHRTFVTPLDRDVIHRLGSRLDDIVDAIHAAAARVVLYPLGGVDDEGLALAKTLTAAAEAVRAAMPLLRNIGNGEDIRAAIVQINDLENAGDDAYRTSLGKLLSECSDVRHLILWKDVYDQIEHALDRCEDVCNELEGIMLENA